VDSEKWIPVKLGANPRDMATYEEAVNAELEVKERKYYNGRLIYETMIVSIDELVFKTDDGEHNVTLMELC